MNYAEELKKYDLKVTPQRLKIVEILDNNGHININDLYTLMKNEFSNSSLATVYKNINTMCEKLFVSEVKIPEQKNVYELNKQEHAHIICSKCNDILDANMDISNLLKQANNMSGYIINESSIILKGTCPNCNN